MEYLEGALESEGSPGVYGHADSAGGVGGLATVVLLCIGHAGYRSFSYCIARGRRCILVAIECYLEEWHEERLLHSRLIHRNQPRTNP